MGTLGIFKYIKVYKGIFSNIGEYLGIYEYIKVYQVYLVIYGQIRVYLGIYIYSLVHCAAFLNYQPHTLYPHRLKR